MSLAAVVSCALLCVSCAIDVRFPPRFQFGASTASYQIEGAWNISDKGESIWDRLTHADSTVIAHLSNGDVACDSYRLWRRDVDMAAELGLQFYRYLLYKGESIWDRFTHANPTVIADLSNGDVACDSYRLWRRDVDMAAELGLQFYRYLLYKGESIWDRFTHADPTVIADLSNGDVACDSYRLWRRDVDMAAELGLQFYRFSISWPRLLPFGHSNYISEAGFKYYSDLIDGLLAKGIEPVVTLYHWDLPQSLQNLGGWTNPLVVDWFASYARVVYSLYADRVKTWLTINEPIVICDYTYSTGIFPPGFKDPLIAQYLCNRHMLLAHAKAWRIYDEQFKSVYHGKVSISNHLVWYKPLALKDQTLTSLVRDFTIGRYVHPIYSKEGGWPASVVRIMKEASAKEGYEVSRLPDFTKEEIELIRGTYDFFAMNYYTCRLVRKAKPGEKVDSVFVQGIPELRAVMEVEPGMPYGTSKIFVLCPKGLRELMSWIKQQYGDLEIFITENGYSTAGSDLRDVKRISFIREHLEQILLSIYVDSVKVTAYTYWSLLDNFEWTDGYDSKFGLYEVDFTSKHRTRTPRASANYYSQVIRSRSLRVNSSNDQYFFKN